MIATHRVQSGAFQFLIPLLPILLVSCEGTAPAQQTGISVDTLASGGLMVSNPSHGSWKDGDGWHVEERSRIGVLDGDGPDVFGEVGALEVDSSGNILIFDNFAKELRVFSRDGIHRRTVGRGGAGPGEFQNVLGMALGPDGDLWMVDGRNARYMVLGSGGHLESVPRTSKVSARPWVGGFDREGRFYDLSTEVVEGELVDRMLQMDIEGEVPDTFAIPRIEVPTPQLGGGMMISVPFAPRMLRAWDRSGGVWQGLSSEYRITNVDLDGDTVLVISREFEPAPFSPAQADSLAAASRDIESQYGVSVDREMRPTAVPPIRWFTPDDEGRLWVCATSLDPCSELDVFDASGSFLGTIPLPVPISDLPVPTIRDGHLYAAVEGESGEPQVFVGRIVVP